MSVGSVLARGRARRQVVMLDRVQVTRAAGVPVFNEDTGEYEAPPRTTVYEGPADVKPRAVTSSDTQSGEREVVTLDYDVALPWSMSQRVAVEDQVAVVASDDPLFVGRVLTVTDVVFGARRTAHHVTAEDRS